jgi:uncharacterized protein YqcC (DUF446 family)
LAICSRVERACHEVDTDCLSLMDDVYRNSVPCADEYARLLSQGNSDVTAKLVEECGTRAPRNASCYALILQGDRAYEYLKSNDTTAAWMTMLVLANKKAWSRDLTPLIRERWRDGVATHSVLSDLRDCKRLHPWWRHIYENSDRFRSLVPVLIRIAEANEHLDWMIAAEAVAVLGRIGDRGAESYLLKLAETSQANAYLQESAIFALTALDGFTTSPARKRLETVARETTFPEVRAFIQRAISEAEKERGSSGHRSWPPQSDLLRNGLRLPPPVRELTEFEVDLLERAFQARRSPLKSSHATWRGKRFRFVNRVVYRQPVPAHAQSALRSVVSCEPWDLGTVVWSPEREFQWIFVGPSGFGSGTIIYAWEPKSLAVRTVAILHGTVVRYRLFKGGWILLRTERRDLALHRSGRLELAQ